MFLPFRCVAQTDVVYLVHNSVVRGRDSCTRITTQGRREQSRACPDHPSHQAEKSEKNQQSSMALQCYRQNAPSKLSIIVGSLGVF